MGHRRRGFAASDPRFAGSTQAARFFASGCAGGFYMKVSRLVSAVFMIVALGVASVSLTACQSTADNSSGASSGNTSGNSGGY